MTQPILRAADPWDVRLERLAFWVGWLVVGLPASLRALMIGVEQWLSIGIYDPALGGDPLLRGGWWQAAALFAAISFAQLSSMAVRRSTLVGRTADGRQAFAQASLLCISLTEVVRTLALAIPSWTLPLGAVLAGLLALLAIVGWGRRPASD